MQSLIGTPTRSNTSFNARREIQQAATNVTIHAGYDIYTRDSETGIQRFSSDINGQLKVQPVHWQEMNLGR